MAELNDEKLKMMEDEMNRFEEEIGLPNVPPPPPSPPSQTVIGANTFSQVEAQLRKIEHVPDGIVPPPPPPPPMFIPQQVQRMGPPMQMDGPRPGMPFGPPGGFPMPGPMRFGPMPPMGPPRPMGGPMGPGPMGPGPMGPGPMSHGPMGPGPMGPGPMGPGPMGPGPMGPGPMGPGPMGPGGPMMSPGMRPMGPGGPGMGPGGPPSGPMGPPMGPPRPMLGGPGPGFIPPPPEFVQAKVQSSQGPVVVSGAPKKYGVEEPMKSVPLGPQYPEELAVVVPEEKKLSKKQKMSAKEMAEKVKASAVVIMHDAIPQQQPIPTQKIKKEKKNKKFIRTAGGQTWEDTSLTDWEDDDFRLFCGDLGNDVTDEVLTRAFSKYSSFLKAKVVRDKRTNKTKGFGFVSFKDPQDFIRATKEMNGRYVGSRPIKLRKSTWRNRSLDVVRKKDKEKAVLIGLLTGRP